MILETLIGFYAIISVVAITHLKPKRKKYTQIFCKEIIVTEGYEPLSK